MAQALEPVIANHLDEHAPVVLEGDFILPSLAVKTSYDGVPSDGQVRALFLYEEDETHLARNIRAREGEEQLRRARASWYYSEWLREECGRLSIPAIPTRPWETTFKRAVDALS
jgi:2-phosphoglycerate kinase